MRNAFPREFYLPKDRPVRVRQFEDVPAVVALFDGRPHGKPVAIGWRGKAKKPAFFFSFRDEERRERYISEWLDGQRKTAEARKEWRAKRNGPHSLKVGQVLYRSWGYDQTNVNWYEVTRVIGKCTVEIREISARRVGEQGGPSERVAPHVGNYIGEPMRKRARSDNSLHFNSYSDCYLIHCGADGDA